MFTHKEYHLACDIGTNAIRILVGRVVETPRTLHVQKQSFLRLPIRLGDDVFCHGVISPQKIQKIIAACQLIQSLRRIYTVNSVQVCATSAVRESDNGRTLVSEVARNTDIHINTIDGDEEARIMQLVVQHAHTGDFYRQLFIDVGGGSTELVNFENQKLLARKSFKIGTVRQLVNKVNEQEWRNLYVWLLQQNMDNIQNTPPNVVGIGGTINTLTKVVHTFDTTLSLDKIDSFITQATDLSTEERQLRWDLRSDKADVIVFGSQIYSQIMHKIGAKAILAPRAGLVDGLVLQAHVRQYPTRIRNM